MPGFTKLFNEIITSSIWSEDDKTRIVWVTMLASCDALGVVRASVSGLAHIARVDKPSCERAIEVLSSPDADSRSPEFDGRRISKVDGGWVILNHTKYRNARNADERKSYMANYMREYRAKHRVNASVNNSNGSLTPVSHGKPQLAQAEAEAEAEADKITLSRKGGRGKPALCPTTEVSKRIAKLYRRRLTTPWSEKEVKAYKKLGIIEPDELTEVETYYARERKKGDQEGRHRRDLITFLNNFRGEVDRARATVNGQHWVPKDRTNPNETDAVR